MDKSQWTAELKDYIGKCRQARPISPRARLNAEEECQHNIFLGEFLDWYHSDVRSIMGQRQKMKAKKFDPEPIYVITSNMPGLAAMQDLLSEQSDQIVWLLHDEFTSWEASHPVDTFTFHIHHASFFKPLELNMHERAKAAYPKISLNAFRLHHLSDAWGPKCGATAEHLWHWDGKEMHLLEEAFTRTVS